jgi:antitoxin (DNA-binding transcriptional repressor) of toxin-antitoxin stability system
MQQIQVDAKALARHLKTYLEEVLKGNIVIVSHYGRLRAVIIPADWLPAVLAAQAAQNQPEEAQP